MNSEITEINDKARTHWADYLDLLHVGVTTFLRHVPDPVLVITPFTRAGDAHATMALDPEGNTDIPTRRDVNLLVSTVIIPVRRKVTNTESSIWVGRATTCDLVLPFEGISRVHAVVRSDGPGAYKIGDLSSKNGTMLNGEPLIGGQMATLPDDALLMFGDVEVTFLLPETFFSELRRRA